MYRCHTYVLYRCLKGEKRPCGLKNDIYGKKHVKIPKNTYVFDARIKKESFCEMSTGFTNGHICVSLFTYSQKCYLAIPAKKTKFKTIGYIC